MVTITSTSVEKHIHTEASTDIPVEYLSIRELEHRCQREIRAFRRTGRGDDRFALEVFRRAVQSPDEMIRNDAWRLIFHQFTPLIISWITQDPRSSALLQDEVGRDSLVNAIFAKMALTFQRTPTKITQFATLGAILKYLKMTSYTIITDEIKALRPRLSTAQLSEADDLAVSDVTDDVALDEHVRIFWRIVAEETFDNELLYLRLTFLDGMKPAEIVATHPQEFPEVEEVYRIRRSIIERLARNQRIRHLRDVQNEFGLAV